MRAPLVKHGLRMLANAKVLFRDRQQIGRINRRQLNAALSADFLMSLLWQPILRIVVKPAVIFHL
jgi:hypothetical protein